MKLREARDGNSFSRPQPHRFLSSAGCLVLTTTLISSCSSLKLYSADTGDSAKAICFKQVLLRYPVPVSYHFNPLNPMSDRDRMTFLTISIQDQPDKNRPVLAALSPPPATAL
ncbi:hypothetical protein pdam_00018776 [Pocillopora damicornis]|uniref:Uncharacterized protein n=1 Tax=Pocillopora damicornis TaxID=46731 RepID=A0A3M6T5L2_POCDA|nr:hypothetical protein pdam_00018776 [Pocillopora damicornis]